MALITYSDKSAMNVNSDVPAVNKVQAADMNEIKTVVNTNYNEFSNIADYVTEIGNNGTWSWRKWNSGWVELFTYHQYSGLNITSSSAGTYYGGEQTINLPFRLVEFYHSHAEETATRSSGVYVYDVSLANNNTQVKTQFRAHASSSNASCGVKFYILGTYK